MKKLVWICLLCWASLGVGKTLNVLSWWGYINNPQIQAIVKKSCNVDLSVDAYYTDNEFFERSLLTQRNYDIAIFSNTIANVKKDKLSLDYSPLKPIINNYLPLIKSHFISINYPRNFYIYGLTVSGILINKNIIVKTDPDNFLNLTDKYKIILLDEPMEGLETFNNHSKINYKNLYISTGYNKIYQAKDFAAAFILAGDALENIHHHPEFTLFIDEKYSYITYDIIAHLNNNDKTLCATKTLLSLEAQKIMQETYFYLSPLGITPKNKKYYNVYNDFINNLDNFKWLDNISVKQYAKANILWKKIKIKLLSSHNEENN